MKEWSHDELHQLIDSDPRLKTKSDEIHSAPPPTSLDEWGEQKRQMMQIYAEVVDCKRYDDVVSFLETVLGYIKKHCSSLDDWKNIASLPEHHQALETFGETFRTQSKCCSPKGNDYLCFCNER